MEFDSCRGTVWYDRTFFVPKSWKGDGLVWIRFGSVHYAAMVVSLFIATQRVCLYLIRNFVYSLQWINGIKVADHKIGHLPFEAEISTQLKFGQENRITVLVGESSQFNYHKITLNFNRLYFQTTL